jgi:hypothetical protein
VIDRLHALLHRPLGEGERRRVFALAVAVILSAAGALALIDEPASRAPAAPPPPQPAATPAPIVSPAPSAPADRRPPSEEGDVTGTAVAAPADVAAAKRAARSFLAAYLPYSYGQRSAAARLPAASASLVRRLRRDRPRVPRDVRRREPRVVLLHADGAGPTQAGVVALIGDGARRYSLPLELELELAGERAGWRVIRVGS